MSNKFTGEIYTDWMKTTQEKKYKDIFMDFIIPIKSNLDIKKDKILDIGVGKGWFEKELFERQFKSNIIGIDIEKTTLATENVNYMLASGDYLPFKDESFKMIVSFDTIHLLKKPSEIERVLKKNGYILISTFCNEYNYNEKRDKLSSIFNNLKILKESLVGDPKDELSYAVLMKKGP